MPLSIFNYKSNMLCTCNMLTYSHTVSNFRIPPGYCRRQFRIMCDEMNLSHRLMTYETDPHLEIQGQIRVWKYRGRNVLFAIISVSKRMGIFFIANILYLIFIFIYMILNGSVYMKKTLFSGFNNSIFRAFLLPFNH